MFQIWTVLNSKDACLKYKKTSSIILKVFLAETKLFGAKNDFQNDWDGPFQIWHVPNTPNFEN